MEVARIRPWLKNYPEGIPSTIDMSAYSSIVDVLERSFAEFGERHAFHNLGTSLTYNEIDRMSQAFAGYLQARLDLKRGDRVAIMMPNLLQYPIALFGILRAGLIAVNVNPLYTERELEHQLRDSGATVIITYSGSAHLVERVLEKTQVQHVIVTEVGDMLGAIKGSIVNFVLRHVKKMIPDWNMPHALKFKDVIHHGFARSFNPEKISQSDIAFLQYTGGTTGVSKGAILTHGNIVANVLQAGAWLSKHVRRGEEIIITPLPLYHIFSLTANCLIFATLGGLNVLITNPRDLKNFIKELKRWRFTAITGVNTLFNGLLNHPDFASVDFSPLRLTLGGGMAVQGKVAERWKEITGCTLVEAYGLTETSPAACINPLDLKDYNGFIGLPIPSTDVVVIDDQEKHLGFNEVGEIAIRGPQVMQGYWQRPDETAKVMSKDGFFKTGDLGFMTNEGYVKIVDRKKDMILVSGFNVYPNEIEDVLITHPKVLEAAAIGVPDEKSNETVKVFIVPRDPSLTEEELRAFCKQNLTGYKLPRYYEFRTELPKSNVGKILRKELRVVGK